MNRLTGGAAVMALALGASLMTGGVASADTANCTATGFMRDNINMTAAQIGGDVTGPLDATGCNIGVYYDNTTSGNVTGADIFGANYFGVLVNGDVGSVAVSVKNSTIRSIGEDPLNGTQHGIAVYYRAFGGTASGIVSGNTVMHYQKGGITVNGDVSASILKNTVTGQGPVSYIAQNGIQAGWGAKAVIIGNTVTGNAYTGGNNASSAGILVYGDQTGYTTGTNINSNTLTKNDVGVYLYNADSNNGAVPAFSTKNQVKNNAISNDAVTNTTGNGACGYQAGIADLGNRDLLVNNSISGLGYTPVTGDCPFVRFIDADPTARIVGSTK